MKKLMLIIATSTLLMFSGSVLAFCVYNKLDTTISVWCDDVKKCQGIKVSPRTHVCVNYRYGSDGETLVIVRAPSEHFQIGDGPVEHFQCEKKVYRMTGHMRLYYTMSEMSGIRCEVGYD